MEDITDWASTHAEIVCKDFKVRNLRNYCDLYVQSDTLLLADVFENLWKMCLEIYPAHFLSAPELAW